MSNEETWDELVELDIRKKLDEERIAILRSQPENWMKTLKEKIADMDFQITQRKATSYSLMDFDVRREYEIWRAGAIARKNHILERYAEAKMLAKKKGVGNGTFLDYGVLLSEILNELKKINAYLAEGDEDESTIS